MRLAITLLVTSTCWSQTQIDWNTQIRNRFGSPGTSGTTIKSGGNSFFSDSDLGQSAYTNFLVRELGSSQNRNFGIISIMYGGATSGTPGDTVAVYGASKGGSGAAPIWGANFVVTNAAGGPEVNSLGVEVDVNNSNTDTLTRQHNGISPVCGGLYHCGIAFDMGAIPGGFNNWNTGIRLQNFKYIGISVGPASDNFGVAGISANIASLQNANNTDNLFMNRATDSAPTGYFVRGVTHAFGPLFALNIDGSFNTVANIQTTSSSVTLSNGANNNIAIGTSGFIAIQGPSGGFSISGFPAGVDGQQLKVFNVSAAQMTIKNTTGSSSGNQILTMTGADVVTRNGFSFATFIYNAGVGYWLLESSN